MAKKTLKNYDPFELKQVFENQIKVLQIEPFKYSYLKNLMFETRKE
jgi:hypothetical protein